MPDSTLSIIEVKGRLDMMERSLAELEESLDQRMGRLEDEMRSSNAHLDNISRASDKTNDLLETEIRDRREEAQRRAEWEREDKKESRTMLVQGASEVWDTFKQPLAYALMALATWFAISQLGVQPQQVVESSTAEVVQP